MSDQIQVVTNTPSANNYELFNVYYGADNRQKRIEWVTGGTGSGVATVNQLYSALQNLFDELTQMDDGVPMSAQTPTEYTIGIIDPGDKDPWFIDRTTVEHLKGGALKTASWARNDDGTGGTDNIGIIKLTVTSNTMVAADIGYTITASAGASSTGTLLAIQNQGSGNAILWIRPTNAAASNSFAASCTLTSARGAFTATLTYDVTPPGVTWETGESLWANVYTLGTIEANTHIYIQQQTNTLLVRYSYVDDSNTDWWGDGHIDVLVCVKEGGDGTTPGEIDEGVITVYARQYSKTYSYYIVDLTSGGRNPIPLQTGKDLDNQTGYGRFTATSTANFAVNDVLYKDSVSYANIRGVITSIDTGNSYIYYYLIGDPIVNIGNDTIINSGTGTCTASAVTTAGPAALSNNPVITFGGFTTGGSYDINEDGTIENYSISIDCGGTAPNQNLLPSVYEWTKYITRRGNSTDIDSGTPVQQGQFYIGSDYRLKYKGTLTATVAVGDKLTQENTGATGYVVNVNSTDKIVIVRNSRGTFTTGSATDRTVTATSGGNFEMETAAGATATAITPIAAASFGTFAGGKFFCAPGIVLTNYRTSDTNNFQLTDDDGNVVTAPLKATITVGNTRAGDKIAVFRLTGSGADIKKTPSGSPARGAYNATVQSAGATTIILSDPLASDEPGKSDGSMTSIRLVDVSANKEYRLRYSTWTNSGASTPNADITLASQTGLVASGTDSDTLTDSGTSFLTTVKVGDLVRNVTEGVVAYVTVVVSDTELTTTPVTDWTGDSYEINTIPVATTTSDTWYLPFIDVYETTGDNTTPGTEAVQITRATTDAIIYFRVRARQAGSILPFEQDGNVTGTTSASVSVVRTSDSIFVP
ncbi:hypothetical protein HZA76_00295 [Candidatus Roizmanbacteria bacterium]|nr:hypothetical protein [Candidatus Roizmanbacteria bacterium]